MPLEKRLGMGLDALLGGDAPPQTALAGTPPEPSEPLRELRIDQLRPNPFQPRRDFRDEETSSLAESIRSTGVLQPILVRRVNGFYEIVAGERRFRAAKLAGKEKIPAVVRPVGDEDMLVLALAENLQRKDLNPLEKARAFRQLLELRGWTQDQAAAALGLARPTVANFVRLLELPPEIQEAVSAGTLSMGHARALAGSTNRTLTMKLLQRVIREDLSVRAVERLVAADVRSARKAPRIRKDANLEDLERRLTERLGTRVEITKRGEGGKILIHFYSTEQLSGMLQLIGLQ